jgi:hypothetical protein
MDRYSVLRTRGSDDALLVIGTRRSGIQAFDTMAVLASSPVGIGT